MYWRQVWLVNAIVQSPELVDAMWINNFARVARARSHIVSPTRPQWRQQNCALSGHFRQLDRHTREACFVQKRVILVVVVVGAARWLTRKPASEFQPPASICKRPNGCFADQPFAMRSLPLSRYQLGGLSASQLSENYSNLSSLSSSPSLSFTDCHRQGRPQKLLSSSGSRVFQLSGRPTSQVNGEQP